MASETIAWEASLDNKAALDRFLSGVERKAYRIASLATGNPDDALDIVQDAMIGLVRKYASRPQQEWKPLFYRILNSRIMDHHRRKKFRNSWMGLFERFRSREEENHVDPSNEAADPVSGDPAEKLAGQNTLQHLEEVLQQLPARQQQAFMLRAWEGLSVDETAIAMGVTAGSVKTHYSRATHTLKSLLEDHWP